MHRYIWLVPLLPLLGAAVNGLLGRRLRFSERLVASVAVGSVALAFLISLAAVVSYGSNVWPRPYVTSEDGAFSYTWIPGGAVELTEGLEERARMEGNRLMDEEAARKARARPCWSCARTCRRGAASARCSTWSGAISSTRSLPSSCSS